MKKLAIILGLCLALILMVAGCSSTEDNTQTDLRLGVTALTALAESHVMDYVDLLKDLAARPEVQSADSLQMKDVLTNASQTRIAAKVFFFLPDGSSYTMDGKTEQNLSDRDYFAKVMAGETVVGTILIGKMSNIKSYLVAVPVKKNGKVVGGLGTTPYLEDLSQTLSQELGLENVRAFYAVDSAGTVALSSDKAQLTVQNPELSKNVEWKTSALTGWRFALGYPK